MKMLTWIIVVLGMNVLSLYGENIGKNNSENKWIESNIDGFQQYVSHKIVVFSSNLDHTFAGDDNESLFEGKSFVPLKSIADDNEKDMAEREADQAYGVSMGFDDFFKNERYLDVTNRSYMKLKGGFEYDQRGESDFFHRLSARLKLPKTQKKLQLFIGGDSDEDVGLITSNQPHGSNGVGLKYYMNSLSKGLLANASIGITSIDNPYVKTHMEYPIYFDRWLFRPMQTFKYSAEDKFDEWTDFYFDRPLSDTQMFRILLERSTNSEIQGMAYNSQIALLNAYAYDISCNYYVGMNGRTKDLDERYRNTMQPQEGVYEYAAGITWRQKVWKDYLFYQLDPIVSWHEQYDYKPNFIFRVTLEMFFGNFK